MSDMKRIGAKIFLLTLIMFNGLVLSGQDIKVSGGFLSDSLRVGDEIFFYLSARSPKNAQIIFPDSAYNYSPFEFRRKRYYVSQTSNGISKDSAVYQLSTFEIDSVQLLRIPVYQVNALDCTRFYSLWDTVKLRLQVKKLPDEISADLPVRATIAYQEVSSRFNYPLIIIGVVLFLLLGAILWFSFGDQLNRHFRIRRMKKNHKEFMLAFNAKISQITERFSREETEAAVTLWKKYMERINRLPYTRLTTSELRAAGKDEPVIKTLKTVDSVIYGYSEKINESLTELRRYADERFETLVKEEANGK
jgi:hypothetical protein